MHWSKYRKKFVNVKPTAFLFIVVLFILLIIVWAAYVRC
ncbi:hypothetical protein DS031_10330 [Bacillus taeanensis]|uniref:Sporulation protein YjcZ n=1 Tax=Bacillus taeanensis TaxID=273032 RepID=A0A366XVD5_9BACI|nr:hypothetical protein DS031_10330 [Bacillus taeanensis]